MKKDYSELFEKMHIAGKLAAKTLDELTPFVRPGVTTNFLDRICYEYIKDHGGNSAPLYYKGFPKSSCTSTNHTVCHGIPSEKILEDGDIMNVDVTTLVDGHHGDTSRTFSIGDVSVKSKNLISATYEAMMKAISIIKPGIKLGDIGAIIQDYVELKGFSVVKDFCGHGIGTVFHKPPNVLHYGNKNSGIVLKSGMTFTVEPMINEGKYDIKILNDGWTAVTKDKTLSAQFEHTVGVTDEGFEIFTKSDKNFTQPPYLL
jgi:methionyl aminopeptidase